MAREIEISMNFLKVVSEASELASKSLAISDILQIAKKLTSKFPFVGAVLGLVKCFPSDGKHAEILRCFEKLSNKIDNVRDDIKDLEKKIKWEIRRQQYGDVANRINLGMQFCIEIGEARDEVEKENFQERLQELGKGQQFTLDLTALFDRMTGTCDFRNSILDEFYNDTKGDRPNISALAIRLLQLICGGMIVLATYETVMRGEKGAKEMTKPFDSRLKNVCSNVQSVLDRCVKNFRDNMLRDLNKKLDEGGSNMDLVTKISSFMHDKYDWLENFCLVYNDLLGSDKHWFDGDRVESLHHKGKTCGIVFYRTKDETPKFSDRYDEAYKIVKGVKDCFNAQRCYTLIVASIKERGIGLTGCAVIKYKPDLSIRGTFSTNIIVDIDIYTTVPVAMCTCPTIPSLDEARAILLLK